MNRIDRTTTLHVDTFTDTFAEAVEEALVRGSQYFGTGRENLSLMIEGAWGEQEILEHDVKGNPRRTTVITGYRTLFHIRTEPQLWGGSSE